MAKNLPSTVADSGSIPTWGTKILHVVGQLNPSTATGEKTHTPQARPDAVQSRGCVTASFVTPQTVAHQTPVHRISRQEYWSGLPFPSPGDLPDPGIEPASPAWQGDSLLLNHQASPRPDIVLNKFFFLRDSWDGVVVVVILIYPEAHKS